MKGAVRIILFLAYIAGCVVGGGAIGVAIARQSEKGAGSNNLPLISAELVTRQDHFFAGCGIGMGVAVIGLVVFAIVSGIRRRKKTQTPAPAGNEQ